MKKIAMLCAVVAVLFLGSGCISSMIANSLVPTPDPRPKQRELNYNQAVNVKVIDALVTLSTGTEEEKTEAAKIIKAIDREGKRAHSSGEPSALSMLGNQIIGNTARPMVEEGIRSGFEWTTSAITEVAGGAVGGTGMIATIIGLARSRNRKTKALNIFKTESTPDELAKIKKAAEHTGLEKEVG